MEQKTKILLYEFVSAGGLGEDDEALANEALASLLAQGSSMRDAVLADLAGLTGVAVTVVDCALAPVTGFPTIRVPAGQDATHFLQRVAPDFDRVWVVAPECEDILLHLCEAVGPQRWVGCDAASIRVAASKQATCVRLAAAGIAVPWGWAPRDEMPPPSLRMGPWVVKPDDGAGAEQMRVFSQFEPARAELLRRTALGQPTRLEAWVGDVQPAGQGQSGTMQALSLSLLCLSNRTELLSINRQRIELTAEGEVRYRGVDIGALALDSDRGEDLRRLASRIRDALPGLAGFVGVDLVLADQQPGGAGSAEPVVIEVNPRVTCAYVGQSRRLGRNLAAEILGVGSGPATTTPQGASAPVIGWDIGGAHVKAALVVDGRVRDVRQCAAPLWQGLAHLDAAIDAVRTAWPPFDSAHHAVTMTAEMTDGFANREAGVRGLADHLRSRLGETACFFAGAAGWVDAAGAGEHWASIASANWLATSWWAGECLPEAMLVDIGSTTTDLIPLRSGQPVPAGRNDADRLSSGELVYVGAVRTPLCALARRIAFENREYNVMNEFFATTADVFRLTGELTPQHDQYPAADGAGKDADATRQRIARMIGRDARDADEAAWLRFAHAWRAAMVEEIDRNLVRVLARFPGESTAVAPLTVVGAGCGLFLAEALAQRHGLPFVHFASLVPADAACREWVDTCAPSVAVALLRARGMD